MAETKTGVLHQADHAHHRASHAAHEHGTHNGHAHDGHGPSTQQSSNLVKDPVCGMSVDPHTAKHRAEHAGQAYYFCSAGCRTKFMADPAKYLEPRVPAAEAVPEGTIYTCPMHPQIRQVGPGNCPICGMALEPVLVTAEAGPNAGTRRHDAPVLDRARC